MNRITSPIVMLVLLLATTTSVAIAQEPAFRARGTGSHLKPIGKPRITNGVQQAAAYEPARIYTASQAAPLEDVPVVMGDSEVVGESIVGEEIVMGEDAEFYHDGHMDTGVCDTCHSPRRLCICLPAHGWVHAEYLMWWQSGMNLPPLVTTSPTGTSRAAAGVLPGASVLFGGDDSALNGTRSGGRIRFGTWFDGHPCWGLEGEYFGLGQQTESFFRQSTGTPILARPFFNITTGREDAELVAFPNVLSGSVAVDVSSQLNGAAARLRHTLYTKEGCGYSRLCCTTVPTSSRLDTAVGYRFYELKESLQVRERLTSLSTANPGSFNIQDRFDTRNQFNGAEIGVLWQGRRGLWSLDSLMRVGIGNTHQTVTIGGTTSTTENGVTTNYNTGILAQRTNIGTYDRNQFTVIPELGLTLGYQFTRRIRLTTGYSLIYWGNVVRPGDQVDRDLNPNLFAPEANPLTGALRPQFQFVSSDYWVQGLNFGAELRW